MRRSFLFAFAAIAVIAGCAKEVVIDQDIQTEPGKREVVINASILQTKTTVSDEGLYSWENTEQIGVVETDGKVVIPFDVKDAAAGTFSGELSANAEPAFAVTPLGAISKVEESEGVVSYDITFDDIDDYVPGTTNALMVAGAPTKVGDNYRFEFRHAAALVKVPVENIPVGTAAVKLTMDKNITGIWEIVEATTSIPTLAEDTQLGSSSLTLTLKDAISAINTSADFYFPVPANTYGSFQFELLDAQGNRIKGVKKSGLNIELAAADLFLTPNLVIPPVVITKGKDYSFTPENEDGKKWTAFGAGLTINGITWTPTLIDGASNAAHSSWVNGRGDHFGTANAGVKIVQLTGVGYDSFCDSETAIGIKDITIKTGAANKTTVSVGVTVGGVAMKPLNEGSDSYTTSDNTDGETSFTSDNLLTGDIVITYTLSTQGALYINTIAINPDNRIDPQFSFDEESYNATVGGSFTAPALQTVDGFSGSVTYALGSEDDPDVASVDASTGAVTIGSKTGSVTVTASFEGDDTYKAASASYTLNVVNELIIYDLYSGEITEGSYLIVYGGAAMNSTVTSDRLQYEEVTANANNQILNPDESIIWIIKADGEYWTLYNDAKSVYAASTGAKNKAKTEASVTDNSRWTISGTDTFEIVNKANTENKNLRRNGTYGFACYATGTGGALTLYKLNDGKENATLSFNPESYEDEIGNIESFIAPTINKTEGLIVSFSSSNTNVATVTDAGVIALAGAVGEATITATAAEQTIGEKTYRAATATFAVKVTKTLPVIAFNEPTTSVNIGETVTNVATITPNTLSFAYSSSDETVATVTNAGVVTGVKSGTVTITASRAADDSYEAASASYEITVVDPNANDGTASKPYTASEAAELALGGSTATVYVKGIISSIATAYSSTNNNISFYISEDGSTNTFEIYRGAATSADQFMVGDYVVFNGSLTKYNTTPELAQGGTCASQIKAPRFSVEAGVYGTAQLLELTADNGAIIYYSTDGSVPTTSSATYSAAISVSDDMTVKAFAVKDGIATGTVSRSYTIDANANDGSAAKPYTASEAAELALGGSTATVYVKGIISSIATAYSSTNNNISFYISEDGSANTFEIYRGAATSADQFMVGDYVVFNGSLTKYNTTPELAQGGTCASQIKAPRFTPDGGSFSTDSQSVTLTADTGAAIYYSLDESEPTLVYSSALSLTATTTVKAKAVLGDITTGVVSKTFTKSVGGTDITLQYTGTETGNFGTDNAAATVGLSATDWSVIADKGSASNNVGYNKAGDIRLYWNASGSNTLTVSSLNNATINFITIEYTESSYSNGKVLVGGTAVTASDGSYPINSTSFVVTNGNTSNTQVRISKIVIKYTANN